MRLDNHQQPSTREARSSHGLGRRLGRPVVPYLAALVYVTGSSGTGWPSCCSNHSAKTRRWQNSPGFSKHSKTNLGCRAQPRLRGSAARYNCIVVWTALAAFTGGAIAVGLKGWVDYALERRRDRRAVQVAARLVYEELWNASAGIQTDLFLGEIPQPEQFERNAWEENRVLIASALDFEYWRLVATSGYGAIRSARELCEEAHGSRTPMNKKLQDDLIGLQFSIANARGVIAELIEGYESDPFPAGDSEDKRREEGHDERERSLLGRKFPAILGRQPPKA